jgi:hypothetical protein
MAGGGFPAYRGDGKEKALLLSLLRILSAPVILTPALSLRERE